MTKQTDIKERIIALLDQIEDDEALTLVEKSLKKLANEGGNDLQQLQELKKERKQLKDEKDKIYNIISYHLGSPLRTLQTLSDMVVKDASHLDKKGILEFNNHLHSQISRLQELMGNLIEWSSLMVKNYQINPSTVALLPLIEQTLANTEKQIENKQLQVRVHIDENLTVIFDKRMLQEVFNNLISNALKFSNKNGKVIISAETHGDKVLVGIKDEGIGMSPSKLKNIFNPSRKATQRGTANELGLGMGLIVAKAFLEENGSQLHIESSRDEWTEVTFELQAKMNTQ